ncbi:hypothetical protein ACWG0P_07175 [Amedibacillus sp. YH-ame6]
MNEKEHFNLPRIKFHEDFKKKKFDKEMALCLVGELQMHWCQYCNNYKDNNCGCYLPPFKKEMIHKINEHFDNPPLNMNNLKQLIGKPIFNNDRKEWFLLLAVRDGANKEIDVISTKKQYKETYGYRDGCFFAREVKDEN